MVVKVGTPDADDLFGGAGDDELHGVAGDDVLAGQNGDDQLFGGEGVDTLNGAAGHDVLYDNVSESGADVWVDFLRGGAGNDTIFGGYRDRFDGGAGDDLATIFTPGRDFSFDFSGLSTTPGARLVMPGGGWVVNVERVSVVAGNRSDWIVGADGDDRLAGGGGLDDLDGGAGADVLLGQAGNDFLRGGDDLAADELIGGAGNDSYDIGAGDIVVEALNGGIDRVLTAVSYTLGAFVESLTLTGAAVSGVGNELNNAIVGNGRGNTLSGGAGMDSLLGLAGADTLRGGDGSDYLTGGAGADRMIGGAGSDYYYVDSVDDVVEESAAADALDLIDATVDWTLGAGVENLYLNGAAKRGTGNAVDNTLRGWNDAVQYVLSGLGGRDTLYGAASGDRLDGGAGDDFLDGLGGADRLHGGPGADRLYGDSAADILSGGAGGDEYYLSGSAAIVEAAGGGADRVYVETSYTLGAELEHLVVYGEGHTGTGNGAANSMSYAGIDGTLRGMGGDDELSGGFGDDLLIGGAGADKFILAIDKGVDEVRDFVVGVDVLEIYTAEQSLSIDDAAFHVGTEAASADHRLIYDAATGALFYDADGVGGAGQIQIAELTAGLSLSADDVI